ncbi:MAG TPA: hypothetical protein VL769_06310 [Acidimicrobiia bacterium]|nr:hypothetical protein [Acidimicrobiia bacterium]
MTADRRTRYPNIQDLYLDVANQLHDGEEFSIVDAAGKTIVSGVWHPPTPSRY